jgi:two-component sensor histidine kinase
MAVVVSEVAFLQGGGEQGVAIAGFDWSSTPLGPIAGWPDPLRIAVSMMVNSRFPKAIVWGADLTMLYNDAFRPILGQRKDSLGRSFRKVWEDVWPDIEPLVERAFGGEAVFLEDLHLVTTRNGAPADAWFTFCYSPIRSADGKVLGIIDTVIETTDKVLAVRDARLLNAELSHRMKNTLAMIGAVANQTFRSAGSIAAAQQTFGERLAALGEAHSLLTSASWTHAPLRDVIEAALAPHRSGGGRIRLAGPHVLLSSRQALSMVLAIHELATNAAKYGSLSVPDGRVAVEWAGEGEAFRLTWTESGGPPAAKPARTGFGSRLINQILPSHFMGRATQEFGEAGMRYEMTGSLGTDQH